MVTVFHLINCFFRRKDDATKILLASPLHFVLLLWALAHGCVEASHSVIKDHVETLQKLTIMDTEQGEKTLSFSFACGGWLQFYLFGVAKAIKESGLHKGSTKLIGCSAGKLFFKIDLLVLRISGALAAAGLACEGDFDKAVEFCKAECIPRVYNRVLGVFKLHEYVDTCLDHAAGLHNYYKLPPGKLQVAVTSLPHFKRIHTQSYTSQADLKQCLLASSAAFPFAQLVHLRNELCIDGGFTDFQPLVDENTVTISPFYFSNTDIKPSRYVPLWWALLPPNDNETIDWVYKLGYDDAQSWISNRRAGSQDVSHITIREKRKRSHPFDTPRKVSMHRFLGFNVDIAVPKYVSYFLDFSLWVALMFVWKPIAICLCYAELAIFASLYFCLAALQEVYNTSPAIICMAMVTLFLYGANCVTLFLMFALALLLVKLILIGPCATTWGYVDAMGECLGRLSSFSLLKRFIPSRNVHMSLEEHEHKKIWNASFMYRVVRHFI